MDDKRALEDFRVRQHAGPHPALAAAAAAAAGADNCAAPAAAEQQAERIVPDTGRVILLFDVDSFYCQVEEVSACRGGCRCIAARGSCRLRRSPLCFACAHDACALCLQLRNPSLRGRPLGVTQKYLIVSGLC